MTIIWRSDLSSFLKGPRPPYSCFWSLFTQSTEQREGLLYRPSNENYTFGYCFPQSSLYYVWIFVLNWEKWINGPFVHVYIIGMYAWTQAGPDHNLVVYNSREKVSHAGILKSFSVAGDWNMFSPLEVFCCRWRRKTVLYHMHYNSGTVAQVCIHVLSHQ